MPANEVVVDVDQRDLMSIPCADGVHITENEAGEQDSATDGAEHRSGESSEEVRQALSLERGNSSLNEAKGSQAGQYKLRMFEAFRRAERAPAVADELEWADWVMQTLEDLYVAAIAVSKEDTKGVGKVQSERMAKTLCDWLGVDNWGQIEDYVLKTLQHRSGEISTQSSISEHRIEKADEKGMRIVDIAVSNVPQDEAWTYVMLSIASLEMSVRGRQRGDDVGFKSGGFNLSSGELNGRLATQNMARKCILAQITLWGYVGLEQTATALLAKG